MTGSHMRQSRPSAWTSSTAGPLSPRWATTVSWSSRRTLRSAAGLGLPAPVTTSSMTASAFSARGKPA